MYERMLNTTEIKPLPMILYLMNKNDCGSGASMQELDINDVEFLQTNVEGLQLSVVPVQGDHFEQAIIQSQPYDPAQGIHNPNDSCFRGTPNSILEEKTKCSNLSNPSSKSLQVIRNS